VAKDVVSQAEALRRASLAKAQTGGKPAPPKARWKFVKNFGAAEVIRFRDGSTFQFRLVRRNDGSGYQPSAQVETGDKILAQKLREAAKAPGLGLVEVKI